MADQGPYVLTSAKSNQPLPPSHLVPIAVVLCGGTVVLQDFGDGALIDALQVKLPFTQFQEAP